MVEDLKIWRSTLSNKLSISVFVLYSLHYWQILADQLLCIPISTKGAENAHHITPWHPGFSDPPTALHVPVCSAPSSGGPFIHANFNRAGYI